jgi:hypothetical protein
MSSAAFTTLQQQPNAGGDRPPRKRRKWYPRYKFDRRSRIGRRSDALFKSFTAQLGSDVPPELAVKVVSACELTALAESYRAAFVRGEATVPLDDLVRLERLAHAAVRSLYLDRRNATQQPKLSDYLAARGGEQS